MIIEESDVLGRMEKSIAIRVPPKKVWEMLAFDKATDWMGDLMTSAEYTSEVQTLKDKFKVGATVHTCTHSGIESDIEIIESIKNEKITSRTTSRNMTSIGTFSLKPTETGTEVTYVMEYEWHSIPWKILGAVLSRWIKKDSEKGLEKLRKILEKYREDEICH